MTLSAVVVPGPPLRDATRLALARLAPLIHGAPAWQLADGATVRAAGLRTLGRRADAAAVLGEAAGSLVQGIPLVSFLEPGGAYGPAWAGHPFASPAMRAGYRLREPDLTRALAALMEPGAGQRGAPRAVAFLRLLDLVAAWDRYAALFQAGGITHGIFGLDISHNEDDRRVGELAGGGLHIARPGRRAFVAALVPSRTRDAVAAAPAQHLPHEAGGHALGRLVRVVTDKTEPGRRARIARLVKDR